MDAYGIVLQHLFHENALAGIAYVVAHEVGGLHALFHFVGYHVAPVASGEAHDESEVAFLEASQADAQVFLDMQGLVVGTVGGRLSVTVGINAEQGEVARVAWPHPVVGVGSELADARRRCAHHADVAVDGFQKQVVAVAAVEGLQFSLATFAQSDVLVFQEAFAYLS